ncbi:CHAT domain-containing protein [Haliangium sp.]|uniref:CHAT domain-containing protein n=1 Tax=Haliangium sp. TaxID=2663208 RepID=UPI003D1379BB
MFNKLHMFDLDAPGGDEEYRRRARSYLRMAGTVPKGPADFSWSKRQLADLEALWLDPDTEGARERLAGDLARFAEKLGWRLDPAVFEDAELHGDEYLLTISSAAAELYGLPWEVLEIGASGTYLTDYSGTLVRYAVPGLLPRKPLDIPPRPGVLFAWSAAGGAVPHEEQGEAIRAAAVVGNVEFQEIADVAGSTLQAALDGGPPSVLHLLCHGMPGPEGEPPRLCWGPIDRPGVVTATRLARMLRPHKDAIRLVVLSACGSGDSALDPLFMSSLAQELHKKGIPNVVASRYPLSVRGSKVLVRCLYDKLLRDAWSLERSLSHTRAALFRPDEEGRVHAGDAYGIQLYACDSEQFVSANGVEAERPVLASYPFGDEDQPVPARTPPRKRAIVKLADNPEGEHGKKRLLALLRRLSEDRRLTYALERAGKGVGVAVETTVDGAQRLLAGWRSGELSEALGVVVLGVFLAEGHLRAASNLNGDGKSSASADVAAARSSATARGRSKAVAIASALVLVCVAAIAAGRVLGAPMPWLDTVTAKALTLAEVEPTSELTAPATPTESGSEPASEPASESATDPASDPTSDLAARAGDDDVPLVAAAPPGDDDAIPPDRAEAALPKRAARPGTGRDDAEPASDDEATPADRAAVALPKPAARPGTGRDDADRASDDETTPAGRARAALPKRAARPGADRDDADPVGLPAVASIAPSGDDGSASAPASRTSPTVPRNATPTQPAPSSADNQPPPPRASTQRASESTEDAPLVPPLPVTGFGATYDQDTQRVNISWKPPSGATGVIVVTNKAGRIARVPTAGQTYSSGPWLGGGTAVVYPPSKTSHSLQLLPEESVAVMIWAFNAEKLYSPGRGNTFVAETE